MIITKIQYGLGNQMFAYALGRYLAYKNKTKLKFDITACEEASTSHHEHYRLGVFNIKENFATPKEIQKARVVKEIRGGAFNENILRLPDNVLLEGLWQCEKYFIEIADIIRNDFTLKEPLRKNSSVWKEKILSAKNPVAIHVRHGDYLSPMNRYIQGVLTEDYYQTCINELKKNFSDMTLFIFSDDLAWARNNFEFDIPTEFVEGCERDVEEIFLISLCKHNIVANSTFSWWGAWLNKNPNKKVFAPTPWIRSGAWPDIIPESWIKIPVNYNKNLQTDFPPIVSVVLYVEDNAKNLSSALTSIFAQNFPYPEFYEVIIVDSSTDNGGNICRQFANKNNVTFLKVKPQTKKYSAWNMGIDSAKGELILFLTSDDFILDITMFLTANIWEDSFRKKFRSRENYISYTNFDKVAPNIICSAQKIEENDFGNLNIQALPNKKFLIKSDETSKNLRTFADVKIDNAQKMIMLASRQIDNSLNTKFFNREFLNKNKIRFDENLGGDAELFFLINAFMHSENITLIPQIFSGQLK